MRNDYGIYLEATWSGARTMIRFPVNPKEISVEYPAANERYNVLALGEIIQPRKPGLRKFSWDDGLFPGNSDGDWVLTSGEFRTPDFYITFLTRCKQTQTVVKLTIDRRAGDGTHFGTDTVSVVVEDFSVTEKGGETGDFYYSIVLTEYRDFKPSAVTLIPNKRDAGAVTAVSEQQRAVPTGQLVVGGRVTVNGAFCYDSHGAKPHGSGNGRTAVVGRLVTTDPTRPCPVLLKTESGGLLGWCDRGAVTAL